MVGSIYISDERATRERHSIDNEDATIVME